MRVRIGCGLLAGLQQHAQTHRKMQSSWPCWTNLDPCWTNLDPTWKQFLRGRRSYKILGPGGGGGRGVRNFGLSSDLVRTSDFGNHLTRASGRRIRDASATPPPAKCLHASLNPARSSSDPLRICRVSRAVCKVWKLGLHGCMVVCWLACCDFAGCLGRFARF